MLTGDRAATARAVARRLKIADVEAELLPADKVTAVERRKRQGQIVAMAGDGINDAPAGITLPRRHRPGADPVDGNHGRPNLAFACIYSIAGVPLAAGLLYPLLGLTLSPSIAAAVMALSSRDSAMHTRLKRARL